MRLLAPILLLVIGACTKAQGSIPDWTIPPQQNPHVIFQAYDFRGEVAVSGGEWDGWHDLGDHARQPVSDASWPWASVTKQVVATLVMQQVEAGTLSLDDKASEHLSWPTAFPAPTVRQLLQHQSGLNNPDDSPNDADGFPSIYAEGVTEKFCLLEMSPPGRDGWRYNNCDYVVLGNLLEAVTGDSLDTLIRTRIAEPAGWTDTRLYTLDEMRDYAGRDATYAVSRAMARPPR